MAMSILKLCGIPVHYSISWYFSVRFVLNLFFPLQSASTGAFSSSFSHSGRIMEIDSSAQRRKKISNQFTNVAHLVLAAKSQVPTHTIRPNWVALILIGFLSATITLTGVRHSVEAMNVWNRWHGARGYHAVISPLLSGKCWVYSGLLSHFMLSSGAFHIFVHLQPPFSTSSPIPSNFLLRPE